MTALAEKSCTACTKDMGALDAAAVARHLSDVNGWSANPENTQISRKWSFKNYAKALDFVNQISEIAESENHHPDIHFGWGYVEVTLSTHSIGGLQLNDFVLAAKINTLEPK